MSSLIASGTVPTLGGDPAGCVQLLLERGADIERADHYGRTATFYACEGTSSFVGIPGIAMATGLHGPNAPSLLRPNVRASIMDGADIPRHVELGRLGNTAQLELLIEAGANVNARDNLGRTPLVAAAKMREGADGAAILLLLEAGAKPREANENHDSLLIAVAATARCEALEALLRYDFDINQGARNKRFLQATPLILAAGSACDAANKVQLLLAHGADRSLKTSNGISALHAAARAGNMDAVTALASSGADVNDPYPAVKKNERSFGSSLASDTWTPLMMVSYRGMDWLYLSQQTGEEGAKALIAAGADVNATSRGGVTALSLAIQAQQPEVVEILLNAGADPAAATMTADRAWRVPTTHLTLAIQYDLEALRHLLDAGVNTNEPVGEEKTLPLFFACEMGRAQPAEALLEAGAEVNARDASGRTPLMIAARDGRFRWPCGEFLELLRTLVAGGADVHARDAEGMTALHHAVSSRSVESINLLLDAGADPKAVDNYGRDVRDHVRLKWGKFGRSEPLLQHLETLFESGT